jgi:hypothetical protein
VRPHAGASRTETRITTARKGYHTRGERNPPPPSRVVVAVVVVVTVGDQANATKLFNSTRPARPAASGLGLPTTHPDRPPRVARLCELAMRSWPHRARGPCAGPAISHCATSAHNTNQSDPRSVTLVTTHTPNATSTVLARVPLRALAWLRSLVVR